MTQTPPWRAPQQRQKARPAQPQPQQTGPRRYRPDIQGLRAIAVLLVILYHAKVPFVTGGYVGVDVFFVISGFLITGQLIREVSKRGRIHFGDFYLKRIRRLLPPAALVVVVTMLAARIWAPPLAVKPWGLDAIFTAFYGINYRLAALGVDYQNADGQESPFQHYWSLAVEEQYYLVWPVLIMAVVLLARSRWRRALLVALILGAGASLFVSVTLINSNAPLAYFSIQSRAWELGVGALVALGVDTFAKMNPRGAAGLSYLGVVLIVGTGLYYTDATTFPGLPATVPVLGAALLIIAGCVPSRVGAESTLLRWRPMQGIGRVSYSWYLWHWPLLILLPMMAPNYHFGWIRNLEVMVLALWLAVLTYFLVENVAIHSMFKKLTWTLRGLLASGAMVGAAAAAIVTMPVLAGNGAALSVASSATAANAAYMQKVDNELAEASLIKAAPKNLTPDLSKASVDFPASSRGPQDCIADYLVVTQGECIFGDPKGPKTMVLIGDSHAEQWQPAYAEAGRREHWKVITWAKSACPLADLTIKSAQLGRTYTECDTWRARTINRVLDMKPDLVVISQSDTVTGHAFPDEMWADKTLEVVQKFRKAGIKTNYLLDTVYPFHDVPKCVTQHLENVRICMASGRVDWVARRHDQVVKTLSAAQVPLIEPSLWQCFQGRCPVVVGNMLVYRDDSHLTATYSRWLAPLVQPQLKASREARVTTLVNASQTVKETPSNLTPTLANAINDIPETSRGGQQCHANYLTVKQSECAYGDEDGKNTAVIFGDSHAGQWEPALDAVGKKRSWRIVNWTKSACPLGSAPGYNPALKREYTECPEWRTATIRRIIKLRPDLVFMSQSDALATEDDGDEEYAARTASTAKRLQDAGLKVHYMLDTAYAKTDIPTCIAANLNDVSKCTRPNDPSLVPARKRALEQALAAAEIPYTDPTSWECGVTICPVVVGNMLVYRDDSHITATYSRWLAPLLSPLLTTTKDGSDSGDQPPVPAPSPTRGPVLQADPLPASPATGSFQRTTISAQGTVTVDHWIRTDTPIRDMRLTLPAARGAAVRATNLEVVADRRLVSASSATVTAAGRTVTFPEPASLVHVRYRLVGAVERSWSVPGRVLVQPAALSVNYSPRVGPTKVSVRGVDVLAMACRAASGRAGNPVPCGAPTKEGWTGTLRENRRNASVIVQAQLS